MIINIFFKKEILVDTFSNSKFKYVSYSSRFLFGITHEFRYVSKKEDDEIVLKKLFLYNVVM